MKAVWRSWLIVAAALVAKPAYADWQLNMTRGVTPFSEQVYELHMIIFWICCAIAVFVFGAIIASVVMFRKSKGRKAAQFSHSTFAEVLWTIIPIIILVAMAIPATRTLILMEQTADAEMTVKITGYQWLWQYEYVEDGISMLSRLDADSNIARMQGVRFSGLRNEDIEPEDLEHYLREVDNPLVLPTETKVRFLITSGDVIHSWWVPDFGYKRDAIPGFINQAWTYIEEPGIYRGHCAELCGKDHAFMPIVVIAKPKEEFAAWMAEQQGDTQIAESEPAQTPAVKTTDTVDEVAPAGEAADLTTTSLGLDELMQRGKVVYEQRCAACHQLDGSGLPPAFPALAGSSVALGPIEDHLRIVGEGRPGTAMVGFGSQLTPEDLAATVTYTRNAFGNETADAVQPALVAATLNQTR